MMTNQGGSPSFATPKENKIKMMMRQGGSLSFATFERKKK
jgi:hypothetical protein